MRRLAVACTCLVALVLPGGETEPPPLGERPAVVVNGEAIELRHLEDELLSQEGADLMLELVRQALRKLDWTKLDDDTTLVTVGRYKIDRPVLAAELLRQSAAKVREDMIDALLVEQRLRADGIVLTEVVLANELRRIERRFHAELQDRDQPLVPFETYLQQTEGLTVKEFKEQQAFRMLTGLHLLVFRHAEVEQNQLKRFFHDHRDRFHRDEQVDLSLIFIPFDEKAKILPAAKDGPRSVLWFCHRQISAGKSDFAREFTKFGRGWDPQAEHDGRVGWVGRDGRRSQVGARLVPKEVMAACFAADREKLPRLLPVQEAEDGVYLFKLHGYREAQRPAFADIVPRVREAFVEENLKELTDRMMKRLRKEAKVEYRDLSMLIEAREATVKQRQEKQPARPPAEAPPKKGE